MKLISRLPRSLHRYFWETDLKKLDLKTHSQYVIQRILEMGDAKTIRWLRKKFGDPLIKETIKKRRGFSPKTATFWSSFLKISPQAVKCLQKPTANSEKFTGHINRQRTAEKILFSRWFSLSSSFRPPLFFGF